jgi:biotin operon repressor/transcriptional regulator with XRE-family HTH domain
MAACEDCGMACWKGAPTCRPCYRQRCAADYEARRACPKCGKPRHRPYASKLCSSCHREERRASCTCIDCGGTTSDSRRKRCAPCHRASFPGRKPLENTLEDFIPAAFRALLDRPEVEWSIAELARRARLDTKTISSWLNGSNRPTKDAWAKVANVLALEACRHCGGSGTIDPTDEAIGTLTRSVQHRTLTVLPNPELIVTGDGWTLDRNSLVLAVGSTAVRVTQQEARLFAVLAKTNGCFVSTAQLGAALGISNHAIHTYLTRVRHKCIAAGADLSQVVENSHGAGYRAVIATRTEAAS